VVNIIAQYPVSNNIAELPGLGWDHNKNATLDSHIVVAVVNNRPT